MSNDDKAADRPSGGSKNGPTSPTGGPKRPTHTIELQAEEVTVKEPEQEEPSEETAAAPQAEAESDAGTDSETDDAGHDTEPQTEEERVRAYRAPQRTRPSDLRGFFTHLAAGLLGGLVGVLGVGYGLGHLPLAELLPAAGEQSSSQADATADRLQALEAQLSQIRSTAEQARQQSAAVPTDDLQSRITRLEGTLKSLGDSAKDGSGGELAQAAALSARITTLGDRLESEIAGLKTEIGTLQGNAEQSKALRGEVDTLSAALEKLRQQVSANAVAPELNKQIDGLGQRITTLEQDVQRAGKAAQAGGQQARMAAFAMAYSKLERRLQSGKPYAAELEPVGKLAPAGSDLAPLKAHADKGVPTVAQLQAAFEPSLRAAEETERSAGGNQWLNKLMQSAESVVTIRRTDPAASAGSDAILARMSQRVSQGEIAGAVQQGETLQGPQRQAMQSWLDDATARLNALHSLEALETQLMTRLGADAAAPAQR